MYHINNMKKKMAVIFIFLIISFLFYNLLNKNKNKERTREIIPQKPSIENGLQSDFSKVVRFKNRSFTFPENLPLINIRYKKFDLDFVNEVKNKLNISENINEFKGIKYYINSNDHFLVATPSKSKIIYGFSGNVFPNIKNILLSDEELQNKAITFLENNSLNINNFFKVSDIKYLKRNADNTDIENTDKEKAEMLQINFSLINSSNYSIVNSYSENPSTFVQILRNGEIYYLEAILFDEIKEGLTNYPLKTFNDIKNNINEAKLIDIFGDYLSVSDINIKDINQIEVDSIKIVYLLEEKNRNYLQPIYLISGNVEIIGSTANQAILYLPAFSSN